MSNQESADSWSGCGTGGLAPERVREVLSRVLASEAFANAPSLRRFLAHLVEHALDGRSDELKEYSLGVDVFGRGEGFDPRTDTIVRVQARRLRAKLGEYYAGRGAGDALVIEVPKGRYVATVRAAEEDADPSLPSLEHIERLTPPTPQGLPAPRTHLVGRARELSEVMALLGNDSVRLITLTGAGGSGKTRLALAAAAGAGNVFPGGIFFAPLASVADPPTVTYTIAQALGMRQAEGRPMPDALLDFVRTTVRKPSLLLLDNFEHLLDASPLLAQILEASASIKIVVTSRAVLHLYGEFEYAVPPLEAPDIDNLPSVDELSRNPAVALFVERARAAVPAFSLTHANAAAIASVCARLDGLPLAIELAAPRLKVLAPGDLRDRLAGGLDLLASRGRDVPARQQTLRKTLEWSFSLLSEGEQKLFRRLTVFAGGFTLESAEAVGNTRRDLGADVLEGLSSLVDKSLIERIESEDRPARFLMLETIREYVLERLAESGETELAREAHAAYYLVLAEEGYRLGLPDHPDWVEECDVEYDNLRAALDWLIASERGEWALGMGLALYFYWQRRERLVEGQTRLRAILSLRSTQSRERGRAKALSFLATMSPTDEWNGLLDESLGIYRELGDKQGIAAELHTLGNHSHLLGKDSEARSLLEECLSVCRELGSSREIAAAASSLAAVVACQGSHRRARSLLDESMDKFRQLGDWHGVAWTLNRQGDAARIAGNAGHARRLYRECRKIFRRLTDPWGLGRSALDLGYLDCMEGDYGAAWTLFDEALRSFIGLGHRRGIAKVLDAFACLAVHQKDPERALTLAGCATALRQRIGAPPRVREAAELDETLGAAWRSLDPEVGNERWEAGTAMSIDEIIRFALYRRSEPGARSYS